MRRINSKETLTPNRIFWGASLNVFWTLPSHKNEHSCSFGESLPPTKRNNSRSYQQNKQGGQELFVHRNCSLCLNTIVREHQKLTEDGKRILFLNYFFPAHKQCVVRLKELFHKSLHKSKEYCIRSWKIKLLWIT